MFSDIAAYAELHCISNFSFLHGASHPEELVERAAALGYSALALTDECSLAGIVRAHVAAKAQGLHLICGSRIDFDDDDGSPDRLQLLLLATDRDGYALLSELITAARMRAGKGCYRALLADLEGRSSGLQHLAGLPGCLAILVPPRNADSGTLLRQARWLQAWFGGRTWIAHQRLLYAEEDLLLERLLHVSQATGLPLVACGNVVMHVRSRKPLHDTLQAIRLSTPVADCGYALMRNAEQHLRSRLRIAQLYPPQHLREALAIASRCRFSLDELRYEYPDEIVPPGHTPAQWLRELTQRGAQRRYPAGAPQKVLAQIEHELRLIAEQRYEPFFLTVHDVVSFARSQGILCQGRGSAANSVVCYCLGITEVDPAEMEVLFERFISKERNEPPDIDVDFEHQRREEVIQYLYRKYGRDRTALAATVVSYRPRSALRDVGKALGIDLHRIEQVAKSRQWWDGGHTLSHSITGAGFDGDSHLARLWLQLTQQLVGFPRHLSQHVGGFVIARDKLSRLVPIENAAMHERSVIQWDKDDLDALGLLKVDVLALGMLTAIRKALEYISLKLNKTLGMHDIPGGDKATYDMICEADTIGVFQIESRAQMSMLPRLKPRTFYDLVIEVAIVRPGPIQGGMVHPYLRRRNGIEPAQYPAPEIRQALERTLGVPIFQEQVMQIAMLAADFTAGEADSLRRAMAAWKRKGGLGPFHARLVGRMMQKGYDEAFAQSLFKQIQGFGEYGFPESHAASFAKLVYVSCWIKRHHADAFLAALLNAQPMGFYQPAQLIADARRHGVDVLPVDVMHSHWDCTLGERPHSVRLGLRLVHGLSQGAADTLIDARTAQPFESVEDMAARAGLDAHSLHVLAAADSLHTLAGHRHQASWQALGTETRRSALMRPTRIVEDAVELSAPSAGETVVADYGSLGFSLKHHPVALLRKRLQAMGFADAASLRGYPAQRLARACGIVTHRQRPETAKGTVFVTLEDETGPVNIIVWSCLVERQRKELLGAQLLGVYGVWQREGQVMHLLAKRLVDHSALLGGLLSRSRDFH